MIYRNCITGSNYIILLHFDISAVIVQSALELCASQSTYSRGMDYQSQSSFDTTGVLGFLAEACNHITATYIETRLEMAKSIAEEEDEDLEGFKDWVGL